MSIDEGKLYDACILLSVPPFETSDYIFLKEYYLVMGLVAKALNMMQADKYTFGLYLPTLYALRIRLHEFLDKVKICKPLVETLSEALERRFVLELLTNVKCVHSPQMWIASFCLASNIRICCFR